MFFAGKEKSDAKNNQSRAAFAETRPHLPEHSSFEDATGASPKEDIDLAPGFSRISTSRSWEERRVVDAREECGFILAEITARIPESPIARSRQS